MFDWKAPLPSPPAPEAALAPYDGLFWGQRLDEAQARDLRALARVFDIDAGPRVPLARLWRSLRPLLAMRQTDER
jgi:hypothetical protein